jgi:hypothetical protein
MLREFTMFLQVGHLNFLHVNVLHNGHVFMHFPQRIINNNSVAPESEDSFARSPCLLPLVRILSHFNPLTPSPQPISVKFILIPYFHLRLGLANGLFPSGFPTKTLYTFSLLSHVCHMSRPLHFPWFDVSNDIWGWVQIMKFLIVQLLRFSCYVILLQFKCSP